MKHNDTTRRFCRTTIEAFGCDATAAYAVERYQDRTAQLVTWMMRAFYLTAAAGAVVLGAL